MKGKFTSGCLLFKLTLLVFLLTGTTKTYAQGNALYFDGNNDYVIIGPAAGFYAVGGAYTKEAWIKKGPFFTAENIISSKDPFWLEYDQHVNATNDYIIPTQEHYDVVDPLKNDNNHWVHMAVTYDGINTTKLYRNGLLVDSHTYTALEPYTSASGQNYIGTFFDTESGHLDYFFTGAMDEVRIYNVALTAAQVQFDMINTTSALPANLLAYYNFDQGTAEGNNAGITTLTDVSGNGNDGIMVNFANTGSSSNFVGSYAMVVPVANAADNITTTSFDAHWSTPTFGAGNIDNYRIEVSTEADFNTVIPGVPFYVPFGTNSYTVTGLNPNTTYYFKVSADKTVYGSQGAFSNTINATTLNVLPVSLVQFSATKGNGVNQLLWSTATEINSKWFELQRSEDGNSFTTITTVNSNGNSAGIKNYQYTDHLTAIVPSVYYYRLKMVDINGSFTYSEKVLVKNAKDISITLYPNPGRDVVKLNITDKSLLNTSAAVTDISGKLIQKINIVQTITTLNISAYEKGVYLVRFANGQSVKLVKD
ncbi:MAG: fibronectin type III domain-containing protein [Bacteroidetes bacterium]|nr:fibronectin type III domain-containing protein [Bacteroidota bacterium]